MTDIQVGFLEIVGTRAVGDNVIGTRQWMIQIEFENFSESFWMIVLSIIVSVFV